MWEGLAKRHQCDDLTWLVEGLKRGTVEWCTDGSYHRGRAPNISGAGWMCCDTIPVEHAKGSSGRNLTVQILIEQSNWAFAPFTI